MKIQTQRPATMTAEELANLENQLRRALHAIWKAQGRECKIVEDQKKGGKLDNQT